VAPEVPTDVGSTGIVDGSVRRMGRTYDDGGHRGQAYIPGRVGKLR